MSTQGSLNIVGNDVTINIETNEAVVSPEYLVNTSEADFMSLKFTPTDKNISFDDYNAFALIMEMDGVVQAMPWVWKNKWLAMLCIWAWKLSIRITYNYSSLNIYCIIWKWQLK